MKSLATLIKLQKSRVDEQRRVLAERQDMLDLIEAEIMALAAQQAQEQESARHAAPEAAVTYGAFIAYAMERARQLELAHAAARDAVEEARAVLAELFEAQKRYETVQTNRKQEKLREERRREQIDLDETAAVAFERKQRDS